MSLDVNALPAHVIITLTRRGHSVEEMAEMSPEQAFGEWAAWHGIDDPLRIAKALDSIRAAEDSPDPAAPVRSTSNWSDGVQYRK